jgi:hypothetical protein
MKKLIILSASLLTFVALNSFADQKATITCTGENVILSEKSPYLGEDTKFSQSLYVLKSTDSSADDESANAAYFLDIFSAGNGSRSMINGTNSVGGAFQLIIERFKDIGDGTIIRESAKGTLTYNHGPLVGSNESVNCIRE